MQNFTSGFGAFHPLALMLWFVSIFIVSMFSMNPVITLLSFAGAVCLALARFGLRDFFRHAGFYLIMFLLIALSNPLFSHNGETPLFYLNHQPVTLEAFFYGLETAFMIVAVLYWFKCFNVLMTSEKFIYLFGRVIPRLSLILSMALRLLPAFLRRYRQIARTQKAIGLFSGKGWTDQIKASAMVFGALVSRALENAIDTGASMLARGYGLPGRSHFSIYRFTRRDLLLICADLACSAVVFTGMATGSIRFFFYPAVRCSWNAASYVVFAAFALLSFLPFIIECKEKLTWNYYISRI